MPIPTPASPIARAAVGALVASQIREVANAGIGDPSVLPFWFGEPDEITPAFIRDEAAASLARGETFYTHNFGILELREAIAAYVSHWHRPTAVTSIAATASGMLFGTFRNPREFRGDCGFDAGGDRKMGAMFAFADVNVPLYGPGSFGAKPRDATQSYQDAAGASLPAS